MFIVKKLFIITRKSQEYSIEKIFYNIFKYVIWFMFFIVLSSLQALFLFQGILYVIPLQESFQSFYQRA